MTTIAYNHKDKEIACDSRMVSNNYIESDRYDKTIKIGDRLFFMAGSVCDQLAFCTDFDLNCKADREYDCSGFMIFEGKAYDVYDYKGRFASCEITDNSAIGSGAHYAMAAIDHGKCAKDAVEYVKTRDPGTGGEVRVFKV